MTDKMRDEFESWAVLDAASTDKALKFEREGEWYLGKDHQVMNLGWAAWQASREALVIELPAPYAVVGDYAACGGGRSVWDVDYAEKITDRMCAKTPVYDRSALEAAGVKVKQ